jgi:hypothetical protein
VSTTGPFDPERPSSGWPWKNNWLRGALERAKGIEPSYAAWEAAVLPLNYARKRIFLLFLLAFCSLVEMVRRRYIAVHVDPFK